MNTIVSVVQNSSICTSTEYSAAQWLLIYCTSGSGCATCPDGDAFPLEEGTVVALTPNTRYRIEVSEDYADLQVSLDPTAILSQTAFSVADNPQKYLRATFEQAWLCMHTGDMKTDYLLQPLAETIINYVTALNAEASYSPPVKKIHNLIMRNYAQCNFALDEAMRQMPFHYDYLRKCFKKEVGITPREYMTQLRMKKARELLTDAHSKDIYVNEIAHKCGFEDPLYFSRIFRKYHSISPSCYAKSAK